ncbi:MAG: UDP-N-acetylglucosamine 1-carboxyvinyltransferase [Candidatus Jacksonbacteria bacterium]
MSKFIIQGPKSLKGEYRVSGFKNAATPIIASTLLIQEECILDNIPRVNDVEKMLDILKMLGAKTEWTDKNQVTINTTGAVIKNIDEKLIKTMRSSILLVGPMLSRFKKITIPEPGGCFLGNRPLNTHLSVLRQFGAKINKIKDKKGKTCYEISLKDLKGTNITLPEFSVTATENAIMLAALAQGYTTIKLAACEPHVRDLIKFLDAAGAKIEEKPGSIIIIKGVPKLRGIAHRIIPDMLEAGTLAVAGALIGKGIVIYDLNPDDLSIVLYKLKRIGVKCEIGQDKTKGTYLKILPKKDKKFKSFKIQALPYPGFPTDLQEPFSLLATQCQGVSLIHDPLFEDRMRHIPELAKMGAKTLACDPHRSVIIGPTPLCAYEVKSPNIRAGGMFVIAGLLAQGETILHDIENTIDRGYERFEEKLNELGAGIRRID